MSNRKQKNCGDDVSRCAGKKIVSLHMTDNCLNFEFEDRCSLQIWDSGAFCCEKRWMTSDDTLPYYIGAEFLDAEVRNGPAVPSEDEIHETKFLIIKTSLGVFTCVTHNEHNGYYGGFELTAKITHL